jgi:hypothetical protein
MNPKYCDPASGDVAADGIELKEGEFARKLVSRDSGLRWSCRQKLGTRGALYDGDAGAEGRRPRAGSR